MMKPLLVLAVAALSLRAPGASLTLHTRALANPESTGSRQPVAVEKTVQWDPKRTAVILCDMWDDHWCKGAAARVGELSGPMNEAVKAARSRGVFVIHAPSSVTHFYDGTPQRERARKAPFSPSPVPLPTAERWGTKWCWPVPNREPGMPIDDSDMGCDCATHCTIREAWKRQTPAIEIAEGDAITDDAQETWNLLAERRIDNVILMGVHLNMCVLGRPFAIRQQVAWGKHVVLCRDLTDTMYNPEMRPKVSHFDGTDLVVSHVERYWCPTITSRDLTGRPPFHFKADERPSRTTGPVGSRATPNPGQR
jgi:nicotinamidase-related amidase